MSQEENSNSNNGDDNNDDGSGELISRQEETEIRAFSESILALASANVEDNNFCKGGEEEAKEQQPPPPREGKDDDDDDDEVAKKMVTNKDKTAATNQGGKIASSSSSPLKGTVVRMEERGSEKGKTGVVESMSTTTTSHNDEDPTTADFQSREQQQQQQQLQPGAYHRIPGGGGGMAGSNEDNNNSSAFAAVDECVGMGIPVSQHHPQETTTTTTFEVFAVKVEPEEEERRVRQQILNEAVQADAVVMVEMDDNNNNKPAASTATPTTTTTTTTTDDQRRRKRCRRIVLGVIVLVVILTLVGVVVGLAIGGSNDSSSSSTTNNRDQTTTKTTTTTPDSEVQTSVESTTNLPSKIPNSTIQEEKDASSTSLLDTIIQADNLRCGVPNFDHLLEYDFEIDLCRAVAAAVLGDPNKVEIIDFLLVDRFVALANKTIDVYARVAYTMERDLHERQTESGFTFSDPYYFGGLVFGGRPDFVKCADAFQTWGNCSDLKVCVAEGTTHQDIIEIVLPKSHVMAIPTAEMAPAMIEGRCNAALGFSYDLSNVPVVKQLLGPGYVIGERVLDYEALSIATRDDDPQWSDVVNSVLQALMVAEEKGITRNTAENFPTTSLFGDGGNGLEKMFQRAIAAVGDYAELYGRYYEDIVPRRGYGGINELNSYHPNPPSSGVIRALNLGTVSRSGPPPIPGGILERIIARDYLICGISSGRKAAGFAEYDTETEQWNGLDIDYCRALSASLFFGRVHDALVFVELTHHLEDAGFLALADGSVDVVCGASVDLTKEVMEQSSGQGFSFSQPYYYENTRPGETRALVTQQVDPQWASFSYWVVASTFYAEAKNITQFSSNQMDEVGLFGPDYRRMFRDAILAVGNYGDLYSRNLGKITPREGLNLLNVGGPMMRPIPF